MATWARRTSKFSKVYDNTEFAKIRPINVFEEKLVLLKYARKHIQHQMQMLWTSVMSVVPEISKLNTVIRRLALPKPTSPLNPQTTQCPLCISHRSLWITKMYTYPCSCTIIHNLMTFSTWGEIQSDIHMTIHSSIYDHSSINSRKVYSHYCDKLFIFNVMIF